MCNNSSKWWKVDFHTHTPASTDYKENNVSAEQWLLAAMKQKLDAVVVTDHNSGKWFDKLKKNYSLLEQSKANDFRKLVIFPGVELTIGESNDRIHLLAILPHDSNSSCITTLIGKCGIQAETGDSETVSTTSSLSDCINYIHEYNGLAIAAHIDGSKGLLHKKNNINNEIVKSLDKLDAIEVCDLNICQSANTELRKKIEVLPIVGGSDAHTINDLGKHFSWVKMGNISIDGLKLSFQEHSYCINNKVADPNRTPDLYISNLSIEKMKFCGKTKTFTLSLSPHFTAIIGGRGSGKSTAIESMRIAAHQTGKDIIPNLEIRERIENLMSYDYSGIMKSETIVRLDVVKDNHKYTLNWDPKGTSIPVTDNENPENHEYGNITSRFPIKIFSQKQIEKLASDNSNLLNIIDQRVLERMDLNYGNGESNFFNSSLRNLESEYLNLANAENELSERIENIEQDKANLKDIDIKLATFKNFNLSAILNNYQIKKREEAIIYADDRIEAYASELNELIEKMEFADLQDSLINTIDQDELNELKEIFYNSDREFSKIKDELAKQVKKLLELQRSKQKALGASKWQIKSNEAKTTFKSVVEKAKENGINLSEYESLIQRKNILTANIAKQVKLIEAIDKLHIEKNNTFTEILKKRELLNKEREKFINEIIGNNEFVKMKIKPFADFDYYKNNFMGLFNFAENTFTSDIYSPEDKTGLLYPLYCCIQDENNNNSKVITALKNIKEQIENIAKGNARSTSIRFNTKITEIVKSNPYLLDKLSILFPKDKLVVQYSEDRQNKKFKDISKGSAGQKAAAVLAFILSYGHEPLIIDQPEDDLDNALIYDLIVDQIQKNKLERQIIVATHNPNIVVNGDAELVNVLNFYNGQITIKSSGGLDNCNIREDICKIMEGGKEAFAKRYNKLMVGDK